LFEPTSPHILRRYLHDALPIFEFFMRELFGADTAVQFRPHFFPFTEPSLEVYVKSKALKSGERWIEVAGSGVVHPAVFEQVNKRSEEHTSALQSRVDLVCRLLL